MPESKAPYDRGWKQTKSRGKQPTVTCAYCGKKIPRFKAFVIYQGFNITDPALKKQLDKKALSSFTRKLYVCPSCARHRGIVQKGKNRM